MGRFWPSRDPAYWSARLEQVVSDGGRNPFGIGFEATVSLWEGYCHDDRRTSGASRI